jgi:hypothetical protein
LAPGTPELSPLLRAHKALQARLVFSGETAPAGFAAVADGQIVGISRDLQVSQL